MKPFNYLILITVLFFVAFNSQGSAISDAVTIDERIGVFSSRSWTHDLTGMDFNPLTITNLDLHVEFRDDVTTYYDGEEIVLLFYEFDEFRSGEMYFYEPLSDASISLDYILPSFSGLLNVWAGSYVGDFYIGNSTLTATSSVIHEPNTILLFCFGMIGMLVSHRPIRWINILRSGENDN